MRFDDETVEEREESNAEKMMNEIRTGKLKKLSERERRRG